MSTSEGKCVLVEEGALISWCIYSFSIVMLLVPYMWASMTFLPLAVKHPRLPDLAFGWPREIWGQIIGSYSQMALI